LSKKLKKKIEDICGLNTLDWEARQDKANQILVSTQWKQQICNDLIGLSFRELEQVLVGIASERQKKEESYERKLEAYRDGKAKRPKSLRGNTTESKSGDKAVRNKHSSGSKNKPRTLKEILAQVHAPRVVQVWGGESLARLYSLRTAEPGNEISPDSDDGDGPTEE
jgi:hypothetical protein